MYNSLAIIDSYMYDNFATTDSTGSIDLYDSPSITDSYIYDNLAIADSYI